MLTRCTPVDAGGVDLGMLSPPLDPITVEFSISIDTSIYPKAVVFRACYTFTDRCYVWLKRVEGATISVNFVRKNQSASLTALQGEFANALIDFALRDSIEQQTREIRATIVQTALAEVAGHSSRPS